MFLNAGIEWPADDLLALLTGLARLAYSPCPGESTDNTTGSSYRKASEDILPQMGSIREWACGALLHTLQASPIWLKSHLRGILMRLGGGEVTSTSDNIQV